MSRERRQDPRTRTTAETTLYYRSLTLMGCRMRDISVTGACIDADSLGDQVLPQNARIDMVLRVNADGELCRVPAKVARVGQDGLGLAFEYSDYEGFCAVVDIVNAGD